MPKSTPQEPLDVQHGEPLPEAGQNDGLQEFTPPFPPLAVPPGEVPPLPVTVPPLPVTVPPLPVTVPPLPVTAPPLPVTAPPLPLNCPPAPWGTPESEPRFNPLNDVCSEAHPCA